MGSPHLCHCLLMLLLLHRTAVLSRILPVITKSAVPCRHVFAHWHGFLGSDHILHSVRIVRNTSCLSHWQCRPDPHLRAMVPRGSTLERDMLCMSMDSIGRAQQDACRHGHAFVRILTLENRRYRLLTSLSRSGLVEILVANIREGKRDAPVPCCICWCQWHRHQHSEAQLASQICGPCRCVLMRSLTCFGKQARV